MIRIELYERARQLAGVDAVEVEAGTLGEALEALARLHPVLVPAVVSDGRLARHWRANVNGRTWVEDPAITLAANDALIIVSALAGG